MEVQDHNRSRIIAKQLNAQKFLYVNRNFVKLLDKLLLVTAAEVERKNVPRVDYLFIWSKENERRNLMWRNPHCSGMLKYWNQVKVTLFR